jgi:hypothetical protein
MSRYNGFNFRSSIAAILCTILFSTTCLVAAAGPVRAAPQASPVSVVAPLA